MDFKKTQYDGGIDAIWRGEAKMLPAGYTSSDTLPDDCVVVRGTPVEIDDSDFTCKIGKSAKVLEGAGTTSVQVAKGHLFVAGDTVADGTSTTTGEGDEQTTTANTATVTAVDSTKEGYDTLTLDKALTGEVIYTDINPNAVVGANYHNDGLGFAVLDIAFNCVVLKDALVCPIADAWKDGINLKGNAEIKLIRQ